MATLMQYDDLVPAPEQGEKGDPGDKGEKGSIMRQHASYDSSFPYKSGSAGERYEDFVLEGLLFYHCLVSCVGVDPKTDVTNNGGHWEVAQNFDFIATKFAIAENAIMTFAQSNRLLVLNSDATVAAGMGGTAGGLTDVALWVGGTYSDRAKSPFRVTLNGEFWATNAHISGYIAASSGVIGGFRINGTGLTNADENGAFTNDAYIIFRNDTHACFAGIGGNILPASSGARGVARFENHDGNDWWGLGVNISVIMSAKNAAYNFAFTGTGNGFLDGAIEGYRYYAFTPNATTNGIDISKGKYIIIFGTYGTCYLPTLASIRSSLGIGSSTNFAVRICVVAAYGATFTLFGYRNGSYNDGTCPHIRDENYNEVTGGIGFGQGDSMDLLLYYNGGYQAQIINKRN